LVLFVLEFELEELEHADVRFLLEVFVDQRELLELRRLGVELAFEREVLVFDVVELLLLGHDQVFVVWEEGKPTDEFLLELVQLVEEVVGVWVGELFAHAVLLGHGRMARLRRGLGVWGCGHACEVGELLDEEREDCFERVVFF